MDAKIWNKVSRLIKQDKVSEAIEFTEGELRKVPETDYHCVLGKDLLGMTRPLVAWLEAFHKEASKKMKVAAIYCEMNGFDINPDEWRADAFAYPEVGALDEEGWLSEYDASTSDPIVLGGLEPLQRAYEDKYLDNDGDKNLIRAAEVTNFIVVLRFMQLVQAAHIEMKSKATPTSGAVLLCTAHDWDLIYVAGGVPKKSRKKSIVIQLATKPVEWSPPPEGYAPHPVQSKASPVFYIDTEGRRVLETPFRAASRFSEGLSAVESDGKWGFINPEGRIVIEPAYEKTRNFSDGHCAVMLQGKWGLIDQRGQLVIPARFKEMGDCGYGLVGVVDDHTVWARYVNTKGDVVIDDSGWSIRRFSAGRTPCRDQVSGAFGFKNTEGSWVVEPTFSLAHSYSEGVAEVSPRKSEKSGYIDISGKVVIPYVHYAIPGNFCDGLAIVVERKTGRRGAINHQGELAIDYKFYLIESFSCGLAAAREDENGPWGFINTHGDFVIPPHARHCFDHAFKDNAVRLASSPSSCSHPGKREPVPDLAVEQGALGVRGHESLIISMGDACIAINESCHELDLEHA